MIRKQDILDRAAEWQLRPEVVEKDYVLGWLLAALAAEPIRNTWIFKGGTSIKKCFFETYRFSEDLDFSLLPDAVYAGEAIREALVSLTRTAAELSGIQFPAERIEVRSRRNKQGQATFEARIAYSGPLNYPGPPRVLFDITQHERVLENPTHRPIFHPYPDPLPESATVATYSFNELLSEKTRALYERSRPRDLYDVVFLLDNRPDAFDLARVRELFREKCRSKGIPAPTADKLLGTVRDDAELRSEWESMLGHQLPALPNLEDLLARLPALLAWIDAPGISLPQARLRAFQVAAGEERIPLAGIQYWGQGIPLENIRFAGANRLLIEFDYVGADRVTHRIAEPYSLRRASTGNILLYAWEVGASNIKAFNTAMMRNVRTTNRSFEPRYFVEFAAGGSLEISRSIAPVGRGTLTGVSTRRPRRSASGYGPKYIFQCPHCQKRFTHSSNDSSLRKHKGKGSWDCPGGTGYLITVR